MAATDKVVKVFRSFKGFDQVLNAVKIISADKGNLSAELKVAKEHVNFMDSLHGGLSATLVDVMTSMALISHEKGHRPSVSINLNMSYLGGAKIGETIEITGKTLKVGKTLAFLQAEIKNKETGILLVKGSHTKFLLDG